MDYATISSEDLVLSCFQANDEFAWKEFVRRFHPLIASVVFRVSGKWGERSPQVIDDLIQETYLKLCADRTLLAQNFRSLHKDAIYGYVKVFTANLVHDYFKASFSSKRGGKANAISIDGNELIASRESSMSASATMDRNVLIHQVDTCLHSVSPGPNADRDRRIFWLYYRVGLAASAIAALPTIGLTTKGVESTLMRLTRQIRHRLVPTKRQGSAPATEGEGIRPAESL